MAGLKEVPAYVRVADDQAMLEMALIENIQRSNLNAVEVAISYQRLMEECDLTHEELSHRLGKSRSAITNHVRLLKLPPQIQTAVKDNQISMGHARALVGIDDLAAQLDIFNQVKAKSLSVRALENLIKTYHEDPTAPVTSVSIGLPPEVAKIKNELSSTLGTKVNITRASSGKGQIVIRFGSDREFNDIIATLQQLQD